jgi:hypothetical protein
VGSRFFLSAKVTMFDAARLVMFLYACKENIHIAINRKLPVHLNQNNPKISSGAAHG